MDMLILVGDGSLVPLVLCSSGIRGYYDCVSVVYTVWFLFSHHVTHIY